MEKKKEKERSANLDRLKKHFEFLGFHVLDCDKSLKRIFDFQADTIYRGMTYSVLIKAQINNISTTVEEAVREYYTKKGKEIWLVRYREHENDPGEEHFYRFEGNQLIQESEDLSLEDALEKPVKSAKSAS